VGILVPQQVHIIIGVPGSGKSWVCQHLPRGLYTHVPHDDHNVEDYHKALIRASRESRLPVLAEAPFRSAILVEQLLKAGIPSVEHYLIEPEHVVRERYEKREGKPIPTQHLSNLHRYAARARMPATAMQLLVRLKQLAE
jgi:predicted kinase